MDINDFFNHVEKRLPIVPASEIYDFMVKICHETMRITSEINRSYHTPEELCQLMSQLTGEKVDPSFSMFPPFYTDFGRNLHLGKNVFINSGCCFQDQGGITIGDGALIGHHVVLATLNHDLSPDRRAHVIPAPIVIGKKVWIGAHATVLQGVTVGDNAVIAVGAVVTRDVPSNTVVAGVPARIVKTIEPDAQERMVPVPKKILSDDSDYPSTCK